MNRVIVAVLILVLLTVPVFGAFYKNVASQSIALFVRDMSTGLPKTGDALNLTAYVSLNFATPVALSDTSAAEVNSVNAPGWYVWSLTQAETNAERIIYSARSTTSDVNACSVLLFPTGFVVDPNGNVPAEINWISSSSNAMTTEEANDIDSFAAAAAAYGLTTTAATNMSNVFDANWANTWDSTNYMWSVNLENIGGEAYDDVLASAEEIADTTNDAIVAGTVQSGINEIVTDTGTTLPALIGTPVDTDLVTDISNLSALIGTPVADVSTDIAAVKTAVDGLELTVSAEDLEAILDIEIPALGITIGELYEMLGGIVR